MTKEYAAIVITPDSIRDGVADLIFNEFATAISLRVVFRKSWWITSMDTILAMYPTLIGNPFCPPIAKNLLSGSCVVLLVYGENLYIRLREVKGRIRFSDDYTAVKIDGIRFKYRTWLAKDLKNLKDPLKKDQILSKIFEYRVHTTDNLKETASLCLLCMSGNEIKKLEFSASDLYREITRLAEEK